MVEEKEVKEDGGRVGEEEEGVSKLVPTSQCGICAGAALRLGEISPTAKMHQYTHLRGMWATKWHYHKRHSQKVRLENCVKNRDWIEGWCAGWVARSL